MTAIQYAVVLAIGVALITLLEIANAPIWVVVLATVTHDEQERRRDSCHCQSRLGLGGDVRPLRLVLGLAAG